MLSDTTLEDVLSQLSGVKKNGGGYMALCPCHDDHKPSLAINQADGKVLVHCHAGCSQEALVERLGLKAPRTDDNIVATYDYTDEDGNLLYQVVRKTGKQFAVRTPDGKGGWAWGLNGQLPVLFGLPGLKADGPIFICEGEKDCRSLRDIGVIATCNPFGAGKWPGLLKKNSDFEKPLYGRDVILCGDNDGPGRAHVRDVAQSLHKKAKSIRIAALPEEYKDVTDYLEGRDAVESETIRKTLLDTAKPYDDGKRRIRLVPFSEVEPKEIEYVIPEILPRGFLTLWAAQEGIGKSAFAMKLAATISRQHSWPPCRTESVMQGRTVIFTREDDRQCTMVWRLMANEGDKTLIIHGDDIVEHGQECDFDIENDMGPLNAMAESLPDLRLVIFDPITDYVISNENSNREVRKALRLLVKFAARHNVAVLALTHLSKKVDLGMINRIIGSRGWSSVPRITFGIIAEEMSDEDGCKIETNKRILSPIKNNVAPKGPGIRFTIEKPHAKIILMEDRWHGTIDAPAGGRQLSRAGEIGVWLRQRIGTDAVPAADVLAEGTEKYDISKQRLGEIANSVGIHKRYDANKKCWVWSVIRG